MSISLLSNGSLSSGSSSSRSSLQKQKTPSSSQAGFYIENMSDIKNLKNATPSGPPPPKSDLSKVKVQLPQTL